MNKATDDKVNEDHEDRGSREREERIAVFTRELLEGSVGARKVVDKTAAGAASHAHEGHRLRRRKAIDDSGNTEGLSDVEVLETLLSYLIPRKDTVPQAHSLLDACDGSLLGVLHAPKSELLKINSMTDNAAEIITLIPELAAETGVRTALKNRYDVIDFFVSLHSNDSGGGSYVAFLDGGFCIIAVERHCGDRIVDAPKIVGSVAKYGAKYVVVSRFDSDIMPARFNSVESVRSLATVLNSVGARLIDCLIFNVFGFYSLGRDAVRHAHDSIFLFQPLLGYSGAQELTNRLMSERQDEIPML